MAGACLQSPFRRKASANIRISRSPRSTPRENPRHAEIPWTFAPSPGYPLSMHRSNYPSLAALFLFMLLAVPLPAKNKDKKEDTRPETQCHLKFNLSSWSVFYKQGKGNGTISCDNGQSSA